MKCPNENIKLSLDLTYQPIEDRLHLILNVNKESVEWWLTRNLTMKIIIYWSKKLQNTALPQFQVEGIANLSRDLNIEHALSLEFDGPKKKKETFKSINATKLVREIVLSVTEIESVLELKDSQLTSKLNLTRKESHAFLEMLVNQSKNAGWIEVPDLPSWLVN